MLKIIFLILPIFVINLHTIYFYLGYGTGVIYFLRPNESNYIIIYGNMFHSRLMRVDTKTDELIAEEILFDDEIYHFKILRNNLKIFTFYSYSLIQNGGKNNTVKFGHRFSDQVYSSNSILIGTWEYNFKDFDTYHYDIQLNLLKVPYNEISKTLIIESFIETNSFRLIGLKDCFIFILIYEESYNYIYKGNYTYKILDLNLNLINSLTINYTNYTDIKFSELSEDNKMNEFIMCIKYYMSITECQIIKYENLNLIFSEKYSIFSNHGVDDGFYKDYLIINLLDGNKIGCYLLVLSMYKYDYVTILQYEDQKLIYYKNIKDIQTPTIENHIVEKNLVKMTMTEKGIAMISSTWAIYLFYISSICLTKTISLYPNSLLEFPINKLIIPGIEQLQFSFVEIHEGLTIYKDSTEIKIGEIFNDLNGFTYFLKIETYFKDFYTLKIKSHEYDYICDINIDIIVKTNISTYKESHKCLKNKNYDKINNITYSNLFDYFNTDNYIHLIQFEFIMEEEPKDNELIFFFDNYTLSCLKDYKKIICNEPLTIFPRLKNYISIHIYLVII